MTAVFVVALSLVVIASAVLGLILHGAVARRRAAEAEVASLRGHAAGLEQRLGSFSRFQGIVDAEATAAAVRGAAEQHALAMTSSAREQAERVVAGANAMHHQATAAVVQLRRDAEAAARLLEASVRQRADATLASANTTHAQAVNASTQLRSDAEAAARHVAAQAASFRAQTEAAASSLRAEADAAAALMRRQAEADASAVRAQAEADAAKARAEAAAKVGSALAQASVEAYEIVHAAKTKAEAVAGEALDAVRDAKRLEATARAMRNVIDGYGNAYILPSVGLLDELAEEFGFAEAGQKLKAARERAREMTKTGLAAECDYVEANRRGTAIEFVLDAFNGKVDTILSAVRHDNLGTMQEKIRDAFTLVNHNGRAFRNARIQSEYLATRLAELKWAVIAQELKLRDREEQRLLKERIREEERAQREYERAMKEAEKEEEALRRAMDKVRREVDKATDEQKAKYEEQLRELTGKLLLAEEKNQRALSMAQQTKAGHVYVISNVGSFGEDVYKIGMTRRLEPRDRVRELGDASVPFEFDVHALIPCDDAPAMELALHKRFLQRQVNKVNPRKEFFRVSLEEIRGEVEQLASSVSCSMTAACREFRESQSIERAMAAHTMDTEAWSEAQLKVLKSQPPAAEAVEDMAMVGQ